ATRFCSLRKAGIVGRRGTEVVAPWLHPAEQPAGGERAGAKPHSGGLEEAAALHFAAILYCASARLGYISFFIALICEEARRTRWLHRLESYPAAGLLRILRKCTTSAPGAAPTSRSTRPATSRSHLEGRAREGRRRRST